MRLTELDKKIIRALQKDLPLEGRPFKCLAKELGMEESALLEYIKKFIKKGVIRRFGATIFHDKSGYEANVMVAWRVPADCLDKVGKIMAQFAEITHCYARVTHSGWPYNLYTMIHGRNKEECLETIKKVVEITGIKCYRLLFTERTFKRTSMQYF
ncbi:MAG TPA: Lrp/AsnC family transcriptional regulator [Candidatus Desulfofervidus auxilii]|uniref:siroheme decarboxylase n=1 Tax=Desulfofervidus auxilii TaxID=1621989 RepID=A0A7V0IA35_DESA2|nr:Lrp/AsnC family transcriptional regulator [Candidatus Desulfofervidus auxilii]